MQIRNAVKHISRGAAGAAMVVVSSALACATPVGSVSISLVSQARASSVEKAAYSKCWWRDGVRHCRRSAERPRLNGSTKEPGYGYSFGNPRAETYPTGTAAWWQAMEREGRTGLSPD